MEAANNQGICYLQVETPLGRKLQADEEVRR